MIESVFFGIQHHEACGLIKTAAGRPYILAPGCDLGSKSPMANVKAMVRACKDLA